MGGTVVVAWGRYWDGGFRGPGVDGGRRRSLTRRHSLCGADEPLSRNCEITVTGILTTCSAT